jgi:hypothetical protein
MTAKTLNDLTVDELSEMLGKGNGDRADARIRTVLKRLRAAEEALAARDTEHKTVLETNSKAHQKAIEDAIASERAAAAMHLGMAEKGLKDQRGRQLYQELWEQSDPKTRPATPADLFGQRRQALAESRKDKTKAAPKLEAWEVGYMDTPAEREKVVIDPTNRGAGDAELTTAQIQELIASRMGPKPKNA